MFYVLVVVVIAVVVVVLVVSLCMFFYGFNVLCMYNYVLPAWRNKR